MINFAFADVTAVLVRDEWINIEKGSLESTMVEIAGKQWPVFLFKEPGGEMLELEGEKSKIMCVPLGSLHAMRCD